MMKKSTLDRVYLKKPCSTEWDVMEGNDQIRFCQECAKQVYDLSTLTRKQAEDLLAKAGGELCAKFNRDDRGRIITADWVDRPVVFRMRLPGFTSAVVTALVGIGVPVKAERPSPVSTMVSGSSAQSARESAEKTQTRDGKPAIVGTVVDVSRAFIVGANVTLTNEKSNMDHTVTTSEAGQYNFETMGPGTYTIKIESSGFVTFKKTGIELRDDNRLRIDVTLQVGTIGGMAILPDGELTRPILSRPVRAIKRALGMNS
jgi:Carboxypeptidase regulatory-like domain